MIRLDDPNAAEQAAEIHWNAWCGDEEVWDLLMPVNRRRNTVAMQAVLDAIEVPRLPTRSEVEAKLLRLWGEGNVATSAATMARLHITLGWAVEDPEPEVDPAQVEALRKLLAVDSLEDDGALDEVARRLLASGRVSVKVDG